MILYCNYTSVVVDFFLIFISWKKGPKCWKAAAPFLYLGLTVIVYILFPLMNFGMQIYITANPSIQNRESYFESWAIFYAVLCISKLLEFWFSIKPSIVKDSIAFYVLRK